MKTKREAHRTVGNFRLVLAFVAVLAGCGTRYGTDPADDRVGLDGVYVAPSAGAVADGGTTPAPSTGDRIRAIAFANAEDYVLATGACNDDACVERGKFVFDDVQKRLLLTNASTGTTAAYVVDVLSTQPFVPENALHLEDDGIVVGAQVTDPRSPAAGLPDNHAGQKIVEPVRVFHQTAAGLLMCKSSAPDGSCGKLDQQLSDELDLRQQALGAARQQRDCLEGWRGSIFGRGGAFGC
jgi:hypothetical protein